MKNKHTEVKFSKFLDCDSCGSVVHLYSHDGKVTDGQMEPIVTTFSPRTVCDEATIDNAAVMFDE